MYNRLKEDVDVTNIQNQTVIAIKIGLLRLFAYPVLRYIFLVTGRKYFVI
jgi:hypothetical protein